MSIVLPEVIGQYREDAATWSYFLHKASKGSWHTLELIRGAEWYLLSLVDHGPVERQWNAIRHEDVAPLLLLTCPWNRIESYIQDLSAVAGPAEFAVPDSIVIHPEEYYTDLWEKKLQVSLAEMMVDSWPVIQRSWSADGYEALEIDRNALNAVAAMVHLAASVKSFEARGVGL